MIVGFSMLVFIPISLSSTITTGLSTLANIFVLTGPLAFFLGATIGGNYGNKSLSKK